MTDEWLKMWGGGNKYIYKYKFINLYINLYIFIYLFIFILYMCAYICIYIYIMIREQTRRTYGKRKKSGMEANHKRFLTREQTGLTEGRGWVKG